MTGRDVYRFIATSVVKEGFSMFDYVKCLR